MAENTGLVFKMFTDLTNFNKGVKNAGGQLGGLQKQFQKFGGIMAGAFSVAAISAFAVKSAEAYNIQAQAEQGLMTALKGRASVQKDLLKQAADLQGTTLFGDEQTIQAQQQLAVMGLTGDQIKKLIPGIQDYATVMKKDLAEAAKMVAKTVGSSTNALRREGIEIDMSGSKAEKAARLAEALNEKFGGQAEAAALVGTGAYKQLGNAIGDLTETFGKAITKNNDWVKDLTNGLLATNEVINSDVIPTWKKLLMFVDPNYNAIISIAGDMQAKSMQQKLADALNNLSELRKNAKQSIADILKATASEREEQKKLAEEYRKTHGILNELNIKISENETLMKQTSSENTLRFLKNQNAELKIQKEHYESIGTALGKMTAKGSGQVDPNAVSSSINKYGVAVNERSGATINTNYGNDAPSLEELKSTAQQASELLSSFRSDILSTAAEGFGLLLTGDMGLGAFFTGILQMTLDFAKQFGKLLIEIGLAKVSLENLGVSGFGAVIAGMALIAAAGAISGLLSKGPSMPALATGTNYIPNDGPYFLHQGEAVVPKKFNNGMGNAAMPAMISVTGSISGRNIRISSERENYFNQRSTGRI